MKRFTGDSRCCPFPLSPRFADSEQLAGRIDDAARRLHGKLVGVDIGRLDVSDYFRNYFQAHMKHALLSL